MGEPLLGRRSVRSLTIRDTEEMQANIAAGKTAASKAKKRVGRGGIAIGSDGVGGRTLREAALSAKF